MATPHLVRIAYASTLYWEVAQPELDALLSKWRRRNAERAITGLLLVHRDSVFQVLEGFPDVVQALYATISHDPRHHLVARLSEEPATERSFGDWSMGLARLIRTDLGALPVLRPLIDPSFRLWHCDEAMARALVDAFSTGPWRRVIR
ncbi:MAG TPA: BLUF domain-containing protein [Kofleriaceae bacterium]|nr:BLUF domain-containing protein [Kofleriaceae bacterium]